MSLRWERQNANFICSHRHRTLKELHPIARRHCKRKMALKVPLLSLLSTLAFVAFTPILLRRSASSWWLMQFLASSAFKSPFVSSSHFLLLIILVIRRFMWIWVNPEWEGQSGQWWWWSSNRCDILWLVGSGAVSARENYRISFKNLPYNYHMYN